MEQSNKDHRKKKARKKTHVQGYNPKAFAVSTPGKMAKAIQRTSDKNEKKLHVPMVDRRPEDDSVPIIVAVVGPQGTGKTTLIKSLVRRLTKCSLNEINGPITVVSSKRRRLTFLECPGDDLNSMIDVSKIADLVLLMIDGNFGFEMETMEFLNLAQHHGMPRVLGVATHLDLFKSQSTLRACKKRLKHRLWSEVYQGAKLFYLSGVINGRYPDREVLNLSRFISVMKFRPLKWRNEHPYLLADRITELTHPELIETQGSKIDRKVAIYGYLHGTPLPSRSDFKVHIAGVGDYTIGSVERLPDPCPTPHFQQKLEEYEREKAKEGASTATTTVNRRKRLQDNQKLIYAPMSDVGGLLMDKDAVYINVGGNDSTSFVETQEKKESKKLVTKLQGLDKNIAEKFDDVGFQLFSTGSGSHVSGQDDVLKSDLKFHGDFNGYSKDSGDYGRTALRTPNVYEAFIQEPDAETDNPASEDEESEHFSKKIDSNLVNGASATDNEPSWEQLSAVKLKNQAKTKRKWDIGQLIYMENVDPLDAARMWQFGDTEEREVEQNPEDNEEEFFIKKEDVNKNALNEKDISSLEFFMPCFHSNEELSSKWVTIDLIKSRFMGALDLGFDTKKTGLVDDNSEEEVYGDFEDLEATLEQPDVDTRVENEDSTAESDDSFVDSKSEEEKDLTQDQERELNAAKKERLRLQFEMENENSDDTENEYDTWYELQKAKIAKQLEINNAEYESMEPEERQRIEGYKAGSYVRIVFEKLPMEFIENFDPKFPVIIGGLLPAEMKFGVINARIRRHRWHKKILKTNDPLVISLGWRRFQTLPIYTTSDSCTRKRMLKYTPEHTYCTASFYGPLCSPSTTFCGVQIIANSQTTGGFRISATGIVEEIDCNVEIVKKLKLVGYPYKIFKNTAFIKDMFSSSMEVARFEGAQIKTVSGIRGEIKRALSKPEGYFRATFEDKILLSDIVVMRTWYPVQIRRFYNPVTSLLLKEKKEWKGLRLVGQIRREEGLLTPSNPDSTYKKVERTERHFNGLMIPKSIRKGLPFKSQVHQMKPQKKKTYMQKRAVILGAEEKKARSFMQQVFTLANAKEKKKRLIKADKQKERLKRLAKIDEAKLDKDKQKRKEYFLSVGLKRQHTSERNESSSSKRKR